MGINQILTKTKREIAFWWFYKNFYKNFVFYTSEDPQELKELYKIRYQVYCEEYSYIEKSKTINNLEMDEWDKYSIHFIIRDLDKEICATVRLILFSDLGFPIEQHFNFTVDTHKLNKKKLSEISRFIVIKKYRKNHLMFVLIKGMYLFIKERKIENIYSVMDDKLFPLLIKMGLPFKKIGKPSIYQGLTYPCIINVKELEEELRKNNKRLYNYLINGVIEFDKRENKYSLS